MGDVVCLGCPLAAVGLPREFTRSVRTPHSRVLPNLTMPLSRYKVITFVITSEAAVPGFEETPHG